MEKLKKRERCVSFSSEEKLLIANICLKYKNIIENKKTDHISSGEKIQAWERIAKEINSAAPNSAYRSPDVLKRFYENRKREARKIAADEKKELFGTGGGPTKNIKKEPCHEIILNIMNPKTVYGLTNNFDGDSIYSAPNVLNSEPFPSCNGSEPASNQENEIEIVCEEDDIAQLLHEDKDPEMKLTHLSWKSYTPADLNKPMATPLKRKLENMGDDAAKNKNPKTLSASRRRPATVVKTLTSSDLGEKYNLLVDKRLEIANLQKQVLEEQLSSISAEKNLKCQLYEIQIAVEKKKLEEI